MTVPHMEFVPGSEHEGVPQPGTAYSKEGSNAGLPADLLLPWHYPVTAHCKGCGEIIRRDQSLSEWRHTGRKPGEPEE